MGVRVVRPDADGTLWLGTESGVARLIARGGQTQRLSKPEYVRSLTRDREGNVWAGNFYDGFVTRWKLINFSNGQD
jgi:ligand-binding sensor domain-containing protein